MASQATTKYYKTTGEEDFYPDANKPYKIGTEDIPYEAQTPHLFGVVDINVAKDVATRGALKRMVGTKDMVEKVTSKKVKYSAVVECTHDISEMLNEMKTFQNNVAILKDDVRTLQHKNENLENDIRTLQHKNKNLENDIRTLQHKNKNLENDIRTLQHKNKNLENTVSDLQDKMEEAEELHEVDIEYLEDKTMSLQAIVIRLMNGFLEDDRDFLQYTDLVQDILKNESKENILSKYFTSKANADKIAKAFSMNVKHLPNITATTQEYKEGVFDCLKKKVDKLKDFMNI
ncbi:hypothetical protein FDP41_008586 [Naegleria fowleri]|uniref:Uncharacterized protein n=1 Tax=Naegleria fowleri TaxID=5763 RepID=A0A6A5BKJ4_NAEFO|nr:uncharacterized protein FDP41_008586 [Naegleria fowleri]KAF0973379.1 hypothetical protein FDP41_008586 [Naegleria fowleri]CAG4716449.1 unnamed protein product [Naegleria fowleri]